MIFVDASAVISILARESDADSLSQRIRLKRPLYYSAMSRWESIMGLCRSAKLDLSTAAEGVDLFFEQFGFEMVPIAHGEAALAYEAARRYGKGRHPAALNMGDCFAYACAKSAGASLLYKGNDFAQTDLA